MGLSDKLHWFAWFAKSIIFLTITITIIACLLKWPIKDGVAVFTNSSFSAIWCFLLLYSVTLIMFCFMLSSFFSKSSTGTMAAGTSIIHNLQKLFPLINFYTYHFQRYYGSSLTCRTQSLLKGTIGLLYVPKSFCAFSQIRQWRTGSNS